MATSYRTYPVDPPVTGPGWFLAEINEDAGTARLTPCDSPFRAASPDRLRDGENDTITSAQPAE